MSQAHRDPEWHRHRRIVARQIEHVLDAGGTVQCVDCGRAIVKGQSWDVGHIVAASSGGTNALSNLGGSHRSCNRKAGGRMGAIKTNRQSRRARRLPRW